MAPPGFDDWMPIAIWSGAIAAALAACLFCFFCTNLPKVLAPRLRKKDPPNEIDGFLGGQGDAPEDFDPDLTLNPVLMDKLKKEKERNARKRNAAGGGPSFAPGALKKLGLQISSALSPRGNKQAGNQITQLDNVDKMIGKDNPGTYRPSAPRTSAMADGGKADKLRKEATERLYAGDASAQQSLAGRQAARAAASCADTGRDSLPTSDKREYL